MLYNPSMAIPVLATKLYIPPPRPNVVARTRLFDLINRGLAQGSRLTLISAPAGFGKTTLVSEWIASLTRAFGSPSPIGRLRSAPGGGEGVRVAWLSLDAEDGDLARFLTYLVAALQRLAPTLGADLLRALQSPLPLSPEPLLTALLNEIAALSEAPWAPPLGQSVPRFVLVLDDYHALDARPVDDTLAFLLEHQPPQMHVVLLTREDPHLPLSRLRARSQLTELRLADLRFTPAEAAEFLNQAMGLSLSAEDISALEARTEGWIAGLQLAALSMQGREDIASFIQAFTGSHRFVLDYLIEEVLQRQPERIRAFLLQTAILERFCAPLCSAVTEREDGKEMLDLLERSNLFLVPLDDQRHWYRYHHLFAEVLQAHLLEIQPEQVSSLHQRASMWYEQNGLRSDAIHHALNARDLERAAGLIELAGPATEQGSIQQAIWLGWVKMLPEELVHTRPVLNVWYAYVLLGRGELEAAESRFRDAERWLESAETIRAQLAAPSIETYPASTQRMVVVDQEQFKSLPVTIAIGRAYIAQALGNIPDTVRYASQVLELMPEGEHFRRAQASMLLGMTYWAGGNLGAADRVFAEFTMKLRKAGNIPDAIGTTAVLADIRLALGHLREAIGTVEQCLHFVMDRGEPIPFDTADLHRALSELYLEQGNLEAAAQHLQRTRELGEKAQLPVLLYRLRIAQARHRETQAAMDGALAMLDEAERLYIRSPLPDFCPISAMKARIWVVQGSLTKAIEWVREQGLSVNDPLSYLHEFEHITLARILIARYQEDPGSDAIHETIGLLERLLQAAEEGGRMGGMIEILVLQALAHQAQGDIPSALEQLERALALAEPEGYVRLFVDEGKRMAELLTRIEAQDCEPRTREYILELLAAIDVHEGISPSGSDQVETKRSAFLAEQIISPQHLIEPLSERELEVLRLLRTELNGPEIARECMVSLSTVRTHTQHIYAKLGVNNRRAAVRRAGELGLL